MSREDAERRVEEARRWLAEPLGTNEARIHVDIGESVEVSQELREALDTLVSELYAGEVTGFAVGAQGSCDPWYECFLRKCQPHYTTPCFVDSFCKITRMA
ncbi:MAG: hypothetical protein E6G01_14730 [Actinobacteria bacterium]|nr:MAG: hypothetical protein E6G01_14730 [Actinomycetota bacterium]